MRTTALNMIILSGLLLILSAFSGFSQNPSWMYWDPWNAPIPSRLISALAIDENDIKWIGTEPVCGGGICTDGGLAAFDGINWIVYDTSNSTLNSNFITALSIDINNIIWAGTGHGEVSSFDGTNWEAHPFPSKDNPIITSIATDLYAYIWVTTEGNGLFMFDGIDWDTYHSGNSILLDYLNCVEVGPDNAVWVGGAGNMLFKYTGTEWIEVSLPDGIYFASTIAIDHENRIWTGSDGIFCMYFAGAWTVFDETITGIPDSTIGYVFDITFDISGNTWIGHSKGLIRYDGSEWTTFLPSNSGLLSKEILSLAADDLGNLWIGTADTGLIAYQEGGVVGMKDLLPPKQSITGTKVFPNPFTSSVTIEYTVEQAGRVLLQVYDMQGRVICILEDGLKSSGTHSVVWDGKNKNGKPLSPGVYLLQHISGEEKLSWQLIHNP